MADTLESFEEAIKQANEAYAAAISTLSKVVQNLSREAPASRREPPVEQVLRAGRLSKDSIIAAIEQGFELWERQVRQLAAARAESSQSGPSDRPNLTERPNPVRPNPIEVWAENWRKATEALATGNPSEELRKQSDAVQKAFVEGIRAWQRLWESGRA